VAALISLGAAACGARPPDAEAPDAPRDVPRLGGPIEILADLPDVPSCDEIVMDRDAVLVSAEGRGVLRIAKAGGGPRVVLDRASWPLAADDDAVPVHQHRDGALAGQEPRGDRGVAEATARARASRGSAGA
jgi:hypothetical protein